MRTAITESRLFVVSDLHLGNPSSTARRRIVSFFEHAREQGASVCVNGDGFDLAQTSFPRLAADTIPVMSALRRLLDDGLRVYYVVGNHDIVLQHFLSDLVFSQLSPFLNLRSGDQYIRIEHGHIYDPWFARSPTSYRVATRLAGYFLMAVPDVYRMWDQISEDLTKRTARLRAARNASDPDGTDAQAAERSGYEIAADRILERGFDTVVFGHTHHALDVRTERGRYLNAGNWLRGSTYVDVHDGNASLLRWADDGPADTTSA